MYYFIIIIIKCKFVNEVKKNEQRQLLQNRYIPSPHTILYMYIAHDCTIPRAKKKTAKGYNFKEDDRALSL